MPGIPGLTESKMNRVDQQWRPQDALVAAGLGAAGGGLYHGLKRNFYNTPEENAEEDAKGPMLLARRMALPAVGLAGLNAAQNSLAPNYYQQASLGNHQSITQPPLNLHGTGQ
jgi:hypothetical protein